MCKLVCSSLISSLCFLTLTTAANAATVSAEPPVSSEPNGCIGIAIESHRGLFVVQKDLPNTPAEAAGMAPGDVLEAVQSSPDSDLTPVSGLTLEQVVEMIRGPIGQPVLVDVIRDGQTLEFLMVREKIQQ